MAYFGSLSSSTLPSFWTYTSALLSPTSHTETREWKEKKNFKEYFLEFLKTTLKGPFIESLLSQKMQAVKLIKLIDSEYE